MLCLSEKLAGMQVSVQEIHILSEPESRYFLRVDRKGQNFGAGFLLLLTNGQDAWKGEVSEAAVYEEAEELEMQKERYIQDLQQALTGTTGSVAYSFTLTPSPPKHSSTVTLEYEKVQKDISFRLGSVLLKAVPQPAEAVTDLLIHSLQRGNTLEQHNQKLEEENQRLRKEHERITTELKRYAVGKEALEAELYSRFVLVLNEKKAKIRSLQEAVIRLQETSSDTRRKRDSVKSDQSAAQEEEAEEDEYGGSTDEEPEEVQSPPAPALRSMEATTPSPLDDSLKDITDVAPCRKRRVRHLRAPDLAVKRPNPDTSHRKSSDSPAGTSKKETPQRSADAASLSAEDLFEDF
ncbi:DNA repair protein XRCC4 X-ray repair cross-complementing protein 4 [Channa argus]|uniref:DNA repair protein XRCC4 X-ray repair cross-complementing protein 4 n=2 Tax=Channa argus TaxID=215402 RepID=A0A6G1QGP9_CHAAH|nr:DNA repair protein XRCC4 X-ray repair cross-complementing protein 4 [Channa argus]